MKNDAAIRPMPFGLHSLHGVANIRYATWNESKPVTHRKCKIESNPELSGNRSQFYCNSIHKWIIIYFYLTAASAMDQVISRNVFTTEPHWLAVRWFGSGRIIGVNCISCAITMRQIWKCNPFMELVNQRLIVKLDVIRNIGHCVIRVKIMTIQRQPQPKPKQRFMCIRKVVQINSSNLISILHRHFFQRTQINFFIPRILQFSNILKSAAKKN